MPLTKKGKKIKSAIQETYGEEKGEEVFYASARKGTIKGGERYRKRKLSQAMSHPPVRTRMMG